MSVVIKGVDMPQCCDECWALDESGDYPYCLITGETRGYNFNTRKYKMDRCPMGEDITPHKGEWITCYDEDCSQNMIFKCSVCGQTINIDMPIISKKLLLNYCPNCGADMRGEENE